ncbi:MAG: twitching motility protein [Parcubacteria group bacterium Athens0714_24]|nr:MAG: twitching motility protein [Parcubacteria group bacterium Athens0714_24]
MSDYKKELEKLILITVKEGASDLHISAGRHPTIRVSGALIPLVKEQILSSEDTEGLVFVMLGEEKMKEFIKEKEFDFSYAFEDTARFRVNAFYQRGLISASLRLIPVNIKNIAELNLPNSLQDFANMEQGFFLVVGPIGHGKSTTLASMIDYINHNRSEHVLTIEDPIEYFFNQDKSIIDQREVKNDTKDFRSALRSMFREDVNVAMVGEMRDLETVSTAITAAETGHLIFSSLHTNNAAQTIDRIIDSFPAEQQNQIRLQLSSALIGVFSQRLVPRISGGLIPAYELLISNSAIKNLIREGKTHEIDIVIETSFEQGMVSLNRSLANLVRQGEVTIDNALVNSLNPKELRGMIG